MSTDPRQLAQAALGLTERAAAGRWAGPDAYDGLWHEWPALLSGGRRRRQALIQLHVRSPLDVRRLYRRSHPQLAKGAALFASIGMRLHRLTGEERPLTLGVDAAETVLADRRAGPEAWGYPFDLQTRWSYYHANDPSIVPTAYAVGALLEAEAVTGRAEFGERARAAARWVAEALWVPEGSEGEGYFTYHPRTRALIHNANLLGAWLAWAALGEAARDQAHQAIARTLAGQSPDGSWPYGAEGHLGWSDSFHTGYVLLCLDRMRDVHPDIDGAVARGAAFYERFFGPGGESRLWANRPYPEDAHAAGTGLSTLALLARRRLISPDLLDRVVARVLSHGIRGGHAVCRRYRWGLRTWVHYLRWCDGHLALGLVDAALLSSGAPDPAPHPPLIVPTREAGADA